MGLLDLFGGGGGSDPGALYGDMLNPQQKQALQQRGLLGFLGGMVDSGALSYTAPFLSGKVPAGFAAGLAGGAAGMGKAQDEAGMNALRARLVGLQGTQLENQIALRKSFESTNGGITAAVKRVLGIGDDATPAPAAGTSGNIVPGGALTGAQDDPRGVAPYIRQAATARGIDPDVALAVAKSEGLGKFDGDGGKSGGAFQLYTGGGLGNQFERDTGHSPLDPKYETETIDYALDHAAQNGWGAWNGAKKIGITGMMGIGAKPAPAAGAPLTLQGATVAPGDTGSMAPSPTGLPPNVAVNSKGMRYSTLPTGGVAAGTPGAAPPISAADAARMNAADPNAGQHLPVMPSNPTFGRGLVAPPGAGTPAPAGLLAAVGGGSPAPAAPQSGLLAAAANGTAPAPSPTPAPAQPGGMAAGGGMDPRRLQQLLPLLGIADASASAGGLGNPYANLIAVLSGLPGYKGAVRGAEQNAANQSDLQYQPGIKGAIKGAESAAEDPFLRGRINLQTDEDIRKAGPVSIAQQNARVGPEIAINQAHQTAMATREKDVAANAPQKLAPTEVVTYPAGSPGATKYQNDRLRGQDMPPGVMINTDGSVTVGSTSTTTGQIEDAQKDLYKLKDEAAASRETVYKAGLLREQLHAIGTSGPLTESLGRLGALAQQVGVPESTIKGILGVRPANVEAAEKLSQDLLGEVLRATFPQRITNTDITAWKNTVPRGTMLQDAYDLLLDKTINPKAERAIARYGAVSDLPSRDPQLRGYTQTLEAFDKANPFEKFVKTYGYGPGGSRVRLEGNQWVDDKTGKPVQ